MSKPKILYRVSMTALAVAALYFGSTGGARAGQLTAEELQVELNNLQSQIIALKAQQEALTQAQAQVTRQAAQQRILIASETKVLAERQAAVPKGPKSDWYMTGDRPAPDFYTRDNKTFFRIGGDLAIDSVVATVPRPGTAAGGLNGGASGMVNFRRAQIQMSGVYETHYLWKIQENLANATSPLGGLLDAYIGYQTTKGDITHTFLVGSQFTPFGFQTSGNGQLFMEDELGNNIFQRPRQVGITGRESSNKFNLWYGLTTVASKSTPSYEPYIGNTQWTVSGVFAWNFMNYFNGSTGHLLSVRASADYNRMNAQSDNGLVVANESTFSSYPDIDTYGNDFINTGALNLQSDLLLSPRVDFEWNRLVLAADYWYMKTDTNAGMYRGLKLQPTFTSWDIEGEYFLTPDVENYSTAFGHYIANVPNHPVTEGGIGSLAITGRLDEANLNSTKYGIHGGNETNLSVGLNWWPMAYTHVILQYTKVFPISGSDVKGSVNYDNSGKSASIVALRLEQLF